MKRILQFLMFLGVTSVFFTSCKKKEDRQDTDAVRYGGKFNFNMNYSVDPLTIQPLGDEYYTGFGDYVTSITPIVFKGKFLDMRIQGWKRDTNMWSENLNLIDNNAPWDSLIRIADFSNNGVVEFIPKLDSSDWSQDRIYNIFLFINFYYYQEFELPEPYDTVQNMPFLVYGDSTLDFKSNSMGGKRSGRRVSGGSDPFLAPVFDPAWKGYQGFFPPIPMYFVFGETDSAFEFTGTHGVQSIDNPIGQDSRVMRSPHFTQIVLHPVPAGTTKTVSGNMIFDTKNLIQIYAGADNIPYTRDDIFVYAPKYWNRIGVTLN